MRISSLITSTSLCLAGLVACQDPTVPAAAAAPVTAAVAVPPPLPAAAVAYELTLAPSFVFWKGKSVGGGGHEGYIKPRKGTLALEADGRIVGGYFELDMSTITNTDQKPAPGKENGLELHLKDPDFFDVKKYPLASFQLVKAVPGANDSSFHLTGQLTIKAVTREINFPATIVHTGDSIRSTAALIIDRTQWGITYQSRSVMGFVKENLLEDLVPISLDLRFKKQ